MSSSIYSSKILLFGEYSIILNSFGFAIPYPSYNGRLKLNASNNDKDSNKNILEFIEYLKINGKNLSLDWLKINKDIANGLFFKIDAALTEQNFVVFGNNNLSNSSTSDLPAGVVKRSNRIWHTDKTGTVNSAALTFDIRDVTGNNSLTVNPVTHYKLLYRSGNSGDFSTVKTADNIINSDNVVFSSVNLNDGYYCIGVTQNNGL